MSKFILKSDYTPQGDQPTAIKQLTDGLRSGLKEQTLLGVTGSGKSVVGSTKVILEHNGMQISTPIKSLSEAFVEPLDTTSDATQLTSLDTLVSPLLKTYAFNPKTGKSKMKNVSEISRHTYTGTLYKTIASNGAFNTFTDSHNVYVLRRGKLCLIKSSDLVSGDYVPVANDLSEGPGVNELDLRTILPEDAFYVAMHDVSFVPKGVMEYQKEYRVTRLKERLKYTDYIRFKLSRDTVVLDRLSTNKMRASIPIIVPESEELWRFIGLFIAEGHASKGYITLSTADQSVAKEFNDGAACFGLKLKKRKRKYDYQVTGTAFSTLLKTLCGHSAYNKKLPYFWPQMNNTQLGILLSGIFAGDGWVEPRGVCLLSASEELVQDIQTALLRFGIHARIRAKHVIYHGEQKQYWNLEISDARDLHIFQHDISFNLERKDSLLSINLAAVKNINTNVNLMPLDIELVKQMAAKYGIYQRHIATELNVTRSLISMYTSSLRVPSRFRAKKLYKYLLQVAIDNKDIEAYERLKNLYGLCDMFWSPIKDIQKKYAKDEVVYDMSVPEHQTFMAGSYFVHNTFAMSNLVNNVQKPTLVLCHNKTLAAQLYAEFKNFFPDNAVHYFVSYFDYYQPEAYIARSDTYIEKDSQINEEIDRLRHAATDSLLTRKDVLIVASVSCIYGIGSVEDYNGLSIDVKRGERRVRDRFLRLLTDIQYQRNDIDFHRSTFRVRGDVVDVHPAGEELAYRFEFFGDEVDRITKIDPLTGEILANLDEYKIFPGSHYVTPQTKLKVALAQIEQELEQRLALFKREGKLLEAQRLEQRTRFDIEMLEETGFVKGIENYSRYLTNREPGEQPATLLDYFPDDYLLLVDESHMSMPQVRGMYNGDRARKEVLVEHGFRLPSALDNRPLTFTEFERHVNQAVYVSATPAQYELSRSPEPAQMVIRPTGLLDPPIEVRKIEGQIDDLIAEIRDTIKKQQRVLVTTLTKRMSEDLTEYLQEIGIKVAYLHSDVDTLDRTDILRDLRLGTYDVLIGINLLREGLDLPEVSLVAILDADKEGFLRSSQALIQTVGRAARHEQGHVIMYADRITDSMKFTIDETTRRRAIQEAYNKEHNQTPTGIKRAIEEGMRGDMPEEAKRAKVDLKKIPKDEYKSLLRDLQGQMELASANLQFEQAAELRDLIAEIKSKQ